MSKGQRAMIAAQIRASGFSKTMREAAKETGVNHSQVVYASIVLEHAPKLAEQVVAGDTFKHLTLNT